MPFAEKWAKDVKEQHRLDDFLSKPLGHVQFRRPDLQEPIH